MHRNMGSSTHVMGVGGGGEGGGPVTPERGVLAIAHYLSVKYRLSDICIKRFII